MILPRKGYWIQSFSSVAKCVLVWDHAVHGSASQDKQHRLKSACGAALLTLLLDLALECEEKEDVSVKCRWV